MITEKLVARQYCANCKHRETCTIPCAPVEALLRSVETKAYNTGELPQKFIEQIKTGDRWPEPGITKKQLILDLYFIDGLSQIEIYRDHVKTTQQYVSRVINKEKRLIRTKAADGSGDP